MDTLVKYKGLKNSKDWEIGNLINYKEGLAAIETAKALYYVFHESVSRFTGCKTNSGIEVYEGDLIAQDDHEKNIISIVYLDQLDGQWKLDPVGSDSHLRYKVRDCITGTVIGHAFTHQHLLSNSILRTLKS